MQAKAVSVEGHPTANYNGIYMLDSHDDGWPVMKNVNGMYCYRSGERWLLGDKTEPTSEWDRSKHGKGTAVVQRSDGRCGVSTQNEDTYLRIRFDDDGSISDYVRTSDVWALDSAAFIAAAEGPLPVDACSWQCWVGGAWREHTLAVVLMVRFPSTSL